MKLIVLVPGETYLGNAGARIRYGRLIASLAARDVHLSLVDIGLFNLAESDADALLISKCHDARAHVAAAAAARRGIPVGVDLFDDNFSQYADARLVRFRRWLTQLVPYLSFVLTSTPAMAEIAATYRPDLPVQVVNDPAPWGDKGQVVASPDDIALKLDRAINQERLEFAWFGIGDNPNFAVGLSDLSAFAGELTALGQLAGRAIDLTVLTNTRALTASRLAMVAALPVSVRVEEWSEDREAALLADSFACFLPVSAQSFSAAKSLNRAVTALAAGCQILSSGYPLYEPLDDLIYREPNSFASDLTAGSMRVAAARHDVLLAALDRWASADREAERVAALLNAGNFSSLVRPGRLALVHGAVTNEVAHQMSKAEGDHAVSSPYASAKLGYDALAQASTSLQIDLLVTEKLAREVRAATTLTSAGANVGGRALVSVSANGLPKSPASLIDMAREPLAIQLALYDSLVSQTCARVKRDLMVGDTILSETSPVPFQVSPKAA